MIGVSVHDHERAAALEFFELFKTPWEFYEAAKHYDVVICTKPIFNVDAKLFIIFSSENSTFAQYRNISTQPSTFYKDSVFVESGDFVYPIYEGLFSLNGTGLSLLKISGREEKAAVKDIYARQQTIFVGYNLFKEILYLMTKNQPKENAGIPTIEYHISTLRNWILEAGIPLVEIPPIPFGSKYFVCLTHDVDFVGIRKHKFDYTIAGFLYRASFGSLISVLNGRINWRKFYLNFKAILSLPLVHGCLIKDFWFNFDKYLKIEKNLRATYFFIPFKNKTGSLKSKPASKKRACRYDITEVQEQVKTLMANDCEVGLHGIDAWRDENAALQESKRVKIITGGDKLGFRSHWLFFDERSPRILDKAGFIYDSSFGFNDAVGFSAGTAQVFKPVGCVNLLELPLILMDTALLNPKRMNLSYAQAILMCDKIICQISSHGGVLTINWHHRSLSPERLWGDFYINMLEKLKLQGVYFTSASEAVQWFQQRRNIRFKHYRFDDGNLELEIECLSNKIEPNMFLRIHLPECYAETESISSDIIPKYQDIRISPKIKLNFSQESVTV